MVGKLSGSVYAKKLEKSSDSPVDSGLMKGLNQNGLSESNALFAFDVIAVVYKDLNCILVILKSSSMGYFLINSSGLISLLDLLWRHNPHASETELKVKNTVEALASLWGQSSLQVICNGDFSLDIAE